MIDSTHAMILIVLGALAAFLVGWDLAIHAHRRARSLLETSLADLEAQVASFHDDMERDPQRAWMNLGKRNVLLQMEATLRIIRSALEPRA